MTKEITSIAVAVIGAFSTVTAALLNFKAEWSRAERAEGQLSQSQTPGKPAMPVPASTASRPNLVLVSILAGGFGFTAAVTGIALWQSRFLWDAIGSVKAQDLLVTVVLCVGAAALAFGLFHSSRARVRFAVFVLIAVLFCIFVSRLTFTLRVRPPAMATEVQAKPGEILLPAVGYQNGQNVARGPLPNLYGPDVLMNAPPFNIRQNSAEFGFSAPAPGKYKLYVRLAAAQPRPLDVTVNGNKRLAGALNVTTGGWLPNNQEWREAGVVELKSDFNTLKLEGKPVFPHITMLKLTPVS
jgi:hypothetical protein